ncbi:MAG: M48 family metallopeptidase [Xanthomonadales bacterium]|nr:M48 family metallopeptidase [Gammaproteobacteria bacterium]MBT8052908.1 M48 family metallopeptidase [Gammaproteobacteria bacterium]NND56191.1 M48 family metallopeptidase [Xanthomonadales bacterium]NNK51563.1 M48 family metallopeptidase [Xanthomonadales bacterium]
MKRESINNDGEVIDYEVIYRPAVTRRLHLELGADGLLQVVAPRRWSRRAIHSTLQQRAPHVARFVTRARLRQQDLPDYQYADGEQHPFMGEWYPLRFRETLSARAEVELRDGQICIVRRPVESPVSKKSLQSLMQRWYRRQALQQFTTRLAAISETASWVTGIPPEMRLRRMKRTWGNCSSRRVITLNPHLLKAPENCIDYVIAHEVCHLRELNHGKAFYALQDELFPGWREAKAHLRTKGHIYLV